MIDDNGVLQQIIATQSRIADAHPDLAEVMRIVAERAQELTSAEAAVVELVDGEEMVYRAATGTAAPHLGTRLSITSSLSGLAVRTGEVLLCADVATDPRVDREACRRVGIRSMIVAPLIHRTQAVGALKAMSPTIGTFGASDVEALQVMAGFIAGAIAHAEAFEANMYLATHDFLTGLPNRPLLLDRLRQALSRAKRNGSSVTVLFIDLDRFKDVNDQFGHAAGDALLRKIGRRLTDAVREHDTVARVGGDEFVVLCEGCSPRDLTTLVERVVAVVESPVGTPTGSAEVGCSIGAATTTTNGSSDDDPDALIARADAAMYGAKRRSTNR